MTTSIISRGSEEKALKARLMALKIIINYKLKKAECPRGLNK